jgi:hypothetical protein
MPSKPITKITDKTSPVAVALRAEGMVTLPRLWVAKEAMEEILKITNRYRDKVNTVRARVHQEHPELDEAQTAAPINSKEAAWAAYERMRA